jgi:hypothetical protein
MYLYLAGLQQNLAVKGVAAVSSALRNICRCYRQPVVINSCQNTVTRRGEFWDVMSFSYVHTCRRFGGT